MEPSSTDDSRLQGALPRAAVRITVAERLSSTILGHSASHPERLFLPHSSHSSPPGRGSLLSEQAGAIGVTYLAAWLGVVEYAALARGETLMATGAGGSVGGAAAQIGKWRGARVIGVDRYQLPSRSPAARAIDDFILFEDEPLDSATGRLTKGQGAKVVFDAVGGPLFEPALRCLAHRGRQLEITSAGDRRVSFDLLDFYHNESRLFGVDTRKRDATASAAILEALTPFFEDGALQAPVIDRVIPLSEGSSAYAQVAGGEARGCLILVP